MMNRKNLKLVFLCFLWLFSLAFPIVAQEKRETINIEITADSLDFANGAIVNLVIKNSEEKQENVKYRGHFSLNKHKGAAAPCVINACFRTIKVDNLDNKIKVGESVNTYINLAALYWHNSILSGIDASFTPNMFTAIPTGEYYVSYVLTRITETDGEKTDSQEYRSNQILVKIDSTKQ